MNCTNCGNNLPDNSVFCPNCGSAVQASPAPQQNMYQQPVNEQQNMYQQPVNVQQNMYQQPMNNQQAVYQQPMNNQQPVYQQPMNNQQTMYQQPMNNPQVYNPYGVPQKKKSKAPWIALGVSLALIIAIVAIVIVLLVSCGPDQSTPDATVQSFMEALSENEQDDCMATIYPPMLSRYTSQGMTEEAAYAYLIQGLVSEFNTTNFKFSNITIFEREVMEQEEIVEGNQELSTIAGYIPMSSGMNLAGTVIVTANGATIPCEWEASVVLADGNYYIVDFDFDAEYDNNYDY